MDFTIVALSDVNPTVGSCFVHAHGASLPILQQVQHARNKYNEGGNEAFLNMMADISLPETKRNSLFQVRTLVVLYYAS